MEELTDGAALESFGTLSPALSLDAVDSERFFCSSRRAASWACSYRSSQFMMDVNPMSDASMVLGMGYEWARLLANVSRFFALLS